MQFWMGSEVPQESGGEVMHVLEVLSTIVRYLCGMLMVRKLRF